MKSTYDKIWESALRSIQIRMMSHSDLKRKLIGKFPEEEGEIIMVMDEMERVMLLDDKRYAENLVNHLIQRPIGRMKIKLEFKKRGLDEELMEPLLQTSGYNEEDECIKALLVKDKLIREADPRKRKMKLMNFLRGRGFRDSIIYKGLRARD